MLHPWNLQIPDWYRCTECNRPNLGLYRKLYSVDLKCRVCLKKSNIIVGNFWHEWKDQWDIAVSDTSPPGWFCHPYLAKCGFIATPPYSDDNQYIFWQRLSKE